MLGKFLLLALLQASTVLDGAYSDTQAGRGKTTYTTHCGSCHGAGLEGVSAPSLTDNRFIDRWREGTLDGLYGFIRARMPFGKSPNSTLISNAEYMDIVTYILKTNGYPSGSAELTMDSAAKIMFVGKNGPQPVPDGALVVTAGCLSRENGTWTLTNAAEPARTRSETASTQAELKASSEKPPGTLTFRLTDLEAVPGFMPDEHQGHKMQAKGYLVRQLDAERISLSSMEMISSTCGRGN